MHRKSWGPALCIVRISTVYTYNLSKLWKSNSSLLVQRPESTLSQRQILPLLTSALPKKWLWTETWSWSWPWHSFPQIIQAHQHLKYQLEDHHSALHRGFPAYPAPLNNGGASVPASNVSAPAYNQLPNLNPSPDMSHDISRSYLKLNFPLKQHFNEAPTAL